MRAFGNTLRRLLANIWVVLVAVLAGWGVAAGFHATGLDALVPDAGGIMIDAITGALGSAVTVYVIALTVQIDATRRAAQAGIADGIIGDIEIPRLRVLVQNEMMKLPHRGSADTRRMFVLEKKPEDFAKHVEKVRGATLESVALAVIADGDYYAEVFEAAVDLLTETFGDVFTHFVVLDLDGNIIAALPRSRVDAWPLCNRRIDYIRFFLNMVKEAGQGDPRGLAGLGFATLRFEVTNSPVELFGKFAEEKASEALLCFNKEIVVGMIELWQLVAIAVKHAAGRR